MCSTPPHCFLSWMEWTKRSWIAITLLVGGFSLLTSHGGMFVFCYTSNKLQALVCTLKKASSWFVSSMRWRKVCGRHTCWDFCTSVLLIHTNPKFHISCSLIECANWACVFVNQFCRSKECLRHFQSGSCIRWIWFLVFTLNSKPSRWIWNRFWISLRDLSWSVGVWKTPRMLWIGSWCFGFDFMDLFYELLSIEAFHCAH